MIGTFDTVQESVNNINAETAFYVDNVKDNMQVLNNAQWTTKEECIENAQILIESTDCIDFARNRVASAIFETISTKGLPLSLDVTRRLAQQVDETYAKVQNYIDNLREEKGIVLEQHGVGYQNGEPGYYTVRGETPDGETFSVTLEETINNWQPGKAEALIEMGLPSNLVATDESYENRMLTNQDEIDSVFDIDDGTDNNELSDEALAAILFGQVEGEDAGFEF